MITKTQLQADKDDQNRVKYQFDTPWDETSLARLYDRVHAEIEFGDLADIVSAVPVSFDKESNTIRVEIVLDVTDIFEEHPNEDDEEEA